MRINVIAAMVGTGIVLLTAGATNAQSVDLRPFLPARAVSVFPGFPHWFERQHLPPALRLVHPVSRDAADAPRIEFLWDFNKMATLEGSGLVPDASVDTPVVAASARKPGSPVASQGFFYHQRPLPLARPSPGASATVTGGGVSDTFRFGTIVRRKALDESEYEAVPVEVTRNGQRWATLHFGYRMGLVAGKTEADVPAAESEDYDLASLPPPFVEGEVVEYLYRPSVSASPWGHFFYAASEADKALLDGNADWLRTGRSFKSGGYLPVCRFVYRPPAGGPATHFYTAKAEECERLKAQPGFAYEGVAFRASLPRPQAPGQAADDPARCPEKTVPLWRYFNAPASTSVAPNHRYLVNRNVGQAMATGSTAIRPWAAEGIALCVPE